MIDQGFGSERVVQQAGEGTFVEVCYAQSMEDASSLCKLLEQHAIKALVETDPTIPDECGVAVLVGSDRLVEASEILTLEPQQHDAGDFADLGTEPDDHDPVCSEPTSDQDDDEEDEDDTAVDLFEDSPDF